MIKSDTLLYLINSDPEFYYTKCKKIKCRNLEFKMRVDIIYEPKNLKF